VINPGAELGYNPDGLHNRISMSSQQAVLKWDYPTPFALALTVAADDTDVMGHTNNVVYLRWLEQVAWAHSTALGLDWPAYQRLNRAMVARRHELDYLQPSFAGDELSVGTWLADNDGKLSMWRRYQVMRIADGQTVLRGLTHWVCVDLESGRPRRMPDEFRTAYAVARPLTPPA
jgi:acyl-CoA thioester hydrolase